MLLFENCKTISVYDLMKTGVLVSGKEADLIILFGSYDGEQAEVQMHINAVNTHPFISLMYILDGWQKNYRINLVSGPFRQNCEPQWYFICPLTGIRCRKLYFSDGYFSHRKAIKGAYSRQIETRTVRKSIIQVEKICALGKMLEKVNAPWFRKTYAGKPTRACNRILRAIQS